MEKVNVSALARANGINPVTAFNRIKKGMSVEEATSTPVRPYRKDRKPLNPRPAKKAERVWAYLLDNRLATPSEVARATGVSYAYAHKLMGKVGTPREVFEKEAKAPLVAERDAGLLDVDDDSSSRWLQVAFLVATAAAIAAWVFSV